MGRKNKTVNKQARIALLADCRILAKVTAEMQALGFLSRYSENRGLKAAEESGSGIVPPQGVGDREPPGFHLRRRTKK